jgi:hypothetical protein
MDIVPRQPQVIASIADLQAANELLWSPVNSKFTKQMLDPNFAKRVMGYYSWARFQDNDFRKEKHLESHAIAVAESIEAEKTEFLKELATKGGRAKRKCALNKLRETEVAKRRSAFSHSARSYSQRQVTDPNLGMHRIVIREFHSLRVQSHRLLGTWTAMKGIILKVTFPITNALAWEILSNLSNAVTIHVEYWAAR